MKYMQNKDKTVSSPQAVHKKAFIGGKPVGGGVWGEGWEIYVEYG